MERNEIIKKVRTMVAQIPTHRIPSGDPIPASDSDILFKAASVEEARAVATLISLVNHMGEIRSGACKKTLPQLMKQDDLPEKDKKGKDGVRLRIAGKGYLGPALDEWLKTLSEISNLRASPAADAPMLGTDEAAFFKYVAEHGKKLEVNLHLQEGELLQQMAKYYGHPDINVTVIRQVGPPGSGQPSDLHAINKALATAQKLKTAISNIQEMYPVPELTFSLAPSTTNLADPIAGLYTILIGRAGAEPRAIPVSRILPTEHDKNTHIILRMNFIPDWRNASSQEDRLAIIDKVFIEPLEEMRTEHLRRNPPPSRPEQSTPAPRQAEPPQRKPTKEERIKAKQEEAERTRQRQAELKAEQFKDREQKAAQRKQKQEEKQGAAEVEREARRAAATQQRTEADQRAEAAREAAKHAEEERRQQAAEAQRVAAQTPKAPDIRHLNAILHTLEQSDQPAAETILSTVRTLAQRLDVRSGENARKHQQLADTLLSEATVTTALKNAGITIPSPRGRAVPRKKTAPIDDPIKNRIVLPDIAPIVEQLTPDIPGLESLLTAATQRRDKDTGTPG